ncbi:MAG: cobalamin-binding protein [Polyangiaceae bacterium]|nr:cobalamin-binding protein [Polyangiaceae bacterium]
MILNVPWQVPKSPQRIVCLTEEITEVLYGLGEESKIVGISAFTERPAEAKERHPVVAGFQGGSVQKIKDLRPDLVIGFSDVQADLAKSLIKAQLPVLIFNQRTIQEILNMMITVGNIVQQQEKASQWVAELIANLERTRDAAPPRPPKVYFEEWDEPQITGIRWVSELIEVAGGIDIFSDRARAPEARNRQVTQAQVIAADPDIILCSWCGKAFQKEAFLQRPGTSQITAIQHDRLHEIPSGIILQPGPAALTDGLHALTQYLRAP